MGFTDDISILWTKEPCEAEPGHCTLTVREAGSPFALMEDIFADTTQTELSAETYRQVNYVNDINRANAQVLMEYAANGNMGTSTTAYGYGIRRESCSMMETAQTAGNVMESVATQISMTYCHTGTGSVANLISSTGNRSYTYAPNGQMSEYAMDSPDGGSMAGNGNMADIGNNSSHGTYGAYGYNGEYTHTDLGLQYLRARYYHMETGTFTSKDTYAGTLTDILSQNRYTYAENNPVTYADPSGHEKQNKKLPSLQENINTLSGKGKKKLPNLLENIRIYNGSEYYNGLVMRTPIATLMSSSGGSLTFAESVAAKVEAARCVAYNGCINSSQEKIVKRTGDEERMYMIYYLNNIDGAKSFGHNAILLVNKDGKGDFYSYMGGGESIWQTIMQETGGYIWHKYMSEEEVNDFLRTGDIIVKMGNGDDNPDNYDRALKKEITESEYNDVRLRANGYEKYPPAYQLFSNNCDDVSMDIIGDLAKNVEMIELLPNNSFYLRTQIWDDWELVQIGANSIKEEIGAVPGGYYILKGLFGRE